MTVTYVMTAALLFLGLSLMLADSQYKLRGSEHRKISVILICMTLFYVLLDCVWIVEYTAENFNRGLFSLYNVLFYLAYITLPYIWFLFANHFAPIGGQSRRGKLIFALPWIFNLVLVLLTVAGM